MKIFGLLATLLVLIFFSLLGASSAVQAQTNPNEFRARALYEQAVRDMTAGDHATALERVNKVQELLGESNARVSALRVELLLELKQYEDAESEYNRFFEYPSSPELAQRVAELSIKIDEMIELGKVISPDVSSCQNGHEDACKELFVEDRIEDVCDYGFKEACRTLDSRNLTLTRPLQLSYPRKALEEGIEGSCNVIYSIDATGRPFDVNATCSHAVFKRTAERAISRLRYEPILRNGIPQSFEDLEYPLTFGFAD